MYGKIFDSMYDGTLYGHWQAIVCFQQMIVLCDADGVVDMTPQAIAARTSIPLEIIQEGLKVLAAPDPYSRSQIEDGKRIVCLDAHRPWGWKIVNHSHYKYLVDSETVKEQNRERQRRWREKHPVTPDNASSRSITDITVDNAPSLHTDTDTDTDTDTERTPLPPGGRAARSMVNSGKLSEKPEVDPEGLDLEALGKWVEYRKERKPPIRAVSMPALKRKLARYGAAQMAVVENSIAEGYQGLFESKSLNGSGAPVRLRTPEEIRAEEDARAEH